jgi:hypothetical protein
VACMRAPLALQTGNVLHDVLQISAKFSAFKVDRHAHHRRNEPRGPSQLPSAPRHAALVLAKVKRTDSVEDKLDSGQLDCLLFPLQPQLNGIAHFLNSVRAVFLLQKP